MKKVFFNKTITFFQEISRSEIIIQAALVGLIAGGLVVLFKVSITELFGAIQNFLAPFTFAQKLIIFPLITTLGGLISGILVFKFAPETRGSGIPYVKMTLARIGKGTRLRSIIVKFLAGLAGIGTGLSLGREGPSVQLGSGAGALVAKIFKKRGTNQHNLISAGAGAALGATFNAPIAGTLFVLEELAQNFTPSILFPVLIATVSASNIARHFLGENPSFDIPKILTAISLESLPVFILLGFFAGIFGVLFAKMIFWDNDLYEKIKLPNWAKPAIAGFAVGVLGLFLPAILGAGNSPIEMLLHHKFTLAMIAIIFIGKFFITPLCFASGAAGGIFLPMLMLGSFLGYFIGTVAHHFGVDVNPVVVSLVGMGAFLSATARTPITAVVMVFEMTGDYNHILPIMFSVAIADLVAEKLNHAPIYSSLILKQGKSTEETKKLSNVKVSSSMDADISKIKLDTTIHDALELIEASNYDIIPVVNNKERLIGAITKSDMETALLQGNTEDVLIEKIMNPEPLIIKQDDDLYKAFYILHLAEAENLFVIDNSKKITGILVRDKILEYCDCYNLYPKSKPEGSSRIST